MKTLRNYTGKMMMMAMAMTMTMALTSCEVEIYDDMYVPNTPANMDYKQSKALSGEWTGDFGMFYTIVNRDRGQSRPVTYDADYTDIVFYPERYGATYGWGKQVDWYSYGPYEYIYHKFDWELVDGVVNLYYYKDSNLDTFIRDYSMTNDFFEGYFGNSSDRFRLRKIVDHYNWTPYVDTYSYGDRRDWYEARQMIEFEDSVSTTDKSDSVSTTEKSDSIVFGNRFLNK